MQRVRASRRTLLAASATGLTLAISGCGNDSNNPDKNPTAPTGTTIPAESTPVPTAPPIASPVPGFLDPNRWQGRSIAIATAGAGDYLNALKSAFFEPFAEATGATVRHEQFGRDGIASLIDQVEHEDRVWDVVLVPTDQILGLASKPYLEAIDYAIVDAAALYAPLCMQHGVGAALYSTVQVFGVTSPEPPRNWSTFWDLSQFMGTRALRKSPVGTLEFALLADGVGMDDLYPIDTARAFAKLEAIREATIFYEDSKQPVELVRSEQVGLASAWSERTALPDVVNQVAIQWEGGMISADSWAVLRGSENADVAMNFISFATRAVPTANFSQLQRFGPVNTDALKLLPDSVLATVPNTPERMKQQFFMNFSYWNERAGELSSQFENWWLHPPATPEA